MTATSVYARSRNGARVSTPPRHIKVSARLAPQIYLGHIYRRLPALPSSLTATSAIKTVVVKCAGQLQRDDSTGRLQGPWKEWQAARQLRSVAKSHANVVQIYDAFVQRSHVFVVMEHCTCGDLLAHLIATQPESRLDQHHALRIGLQLARGLQFLHETCNLAHRDVSLENVFVTREGVHKIGDFGLSTRADTRARGCVGKTQYVAPEVVGATSYDPVAADVWSLGILLFMLLTGAPLLEFASPKCPDFETVRALGCRGVLRLWGMDTQLSTSVMDLLSEMLEFDPVKRIQSMAQVLRHPAIIAVAMHPISDGKVDQR